MTTLLDRIDTYLSEASVPGRAWSGKLKKLDDLLSWMYNKDILNKSEKAEKDKTFNAYYRYYNDGDIPRGMKYSGEEYIKGEIEKKIEDFIKKILSKYWNKIDRNDFRLDTLIDAYSTLLDEVEDDEYFDASTIMYFSNNLSKNTTDSEEIFSIINTVILLAEKLSEKIDNLITNNTYTGKLKSTNKVLGTKYKILLDEKYLPAEYIKLWNELKKSRNLLGAHIKNLILAVRQLKQFKNN